MSRAQEIVFTGGGVVCAAGSELAEVAAAIFCGKSFIAEITAWNIEGWKGRKAGQVTVDKRRLVEDRKLHKFITRTDMLGLFAGRQALETSGILAHREVWEGNKEIFNDRSGVYVGSGGGSYQNNYDFFPVLEEINGDQSRFGQVMGGVVSPMWLLRNLPNNVLCHIGIQHGFKGSNACVTNQCTSGVQALAEAAGVIQYDEADRCVAVAHDNPIEPETVLYYEHLGLMTHGDLSPFSRNRRGTILGEGSAAVMLEQRAEAEARGATILGTFLGSASATEAVGIVKIRPDGDGVARAVRGALSQARLEASDIGFIVAHGNGTYMSDHSEALAYRQVFGSDIPPVTAFKWCYGHTLSASGLMDVVTTLAVSKDGVVPGIPRLGEIDPAFSFLPVSAKPQERRNQVALVVGRGFGGVNTATIIALP